MVRWRGRRQSDNVEDRRGRGGGFGFPFPGGGRRGMRIPLPGGGGRGGGGIGIVGLLVILGLMFFFGVDPRIILGGGGGGQVQQPRFDPGQGGLPKVDIPGMPGTEKTRRREVSTGRPNRPTGGSQDELASFVKVVLADTEDVWNRLFASFNRQYREPKLILFTGFTQTRCGPGMAAMGPFYCPLDQNVYVDLSFYRELRDKFGAPGDFAQAYVIAHEVGHHVQTLLGISEKVQAAKQRMRQRDANALQVRMELQADCLAGVWANHADRESNILEEGDIEEGLRAASAIGDDMIQRKTQGRVVPDAFTHGSSEQRVRWFRRGLETGNMQECDTFSARRL